MDEAAIKERFGDVSLKSAVPNEENPAFDSLLSAMESVHTGKSPMSLLTKYYEVLTSQNNENKARLQASLKDNPDDNNTKIVLGSLELVTVMLEKIKKYTDEPTPDNMADAVSIFLTVMDKVNKVRAAI